MTLPDSVVSSPAVGDVNGDYRNEIVVGCDDGAALRLRLPWNALWYYSTGSPVRTTPALADLNGDGKLEIICASGTKIYVLTGDGEPSQGLAVQVEDVTFTGPAVGDVDGDGALEIAATARINDVGLEGLPLRSERRAACRRVARSARRESSRPGPRSVTLTSPATASRSSSERRTAAYS